MKFVIPGGGEATTCECIGSAEAGETTLNENNKKRVECGLYDEDEPFCYVKDIKSCKNTTAEKGQRGVSSAGKYKGQSMWWTTEPCSTGSSSRYFSVSLFSRARKNL